MQLTPGVALLTVGLLVSLPTCRRAGDAPEDAGAPLVTPEPSVRPQAPPPDWQAPPGLDLWDVWFAGGDQVECYPTLTAMFRGADHVVLGRFEDLQIAEVLGHDEAVVVMASLRVRVTQPLRSD